MDSMYSMDSTRIAWGTEKYTNCGSEERGVVVAIFKFARSQILISLEHGGRIRSDGGNGLT